MKLDDVIKFLDKNNQYNYDVVSFDETTNTLTLNNIYGDLTLEFDDTVEPLNLIIDAECTVSVTIENSDSRFVEMFKNWDITRGNLIIGNLNTKNSRFECNCERCNTIFIQSEIDFKNTKINNKGKTNDFKSCEILNFNEYTNVYSSTSFYNCQFDKEDNLVADTFYGREIKFANCNIRSIDTSKLKITPSLIFRLCELENIIGNNYSKVNIAENKTDFNFESHKTNADVFSFQNTRINAIGYDTLIKHIDLYRKLKDEYKNNSIVLLTVIHGDIYVETNVQQPSTSKKNLTHKGFTPILNKVVGIMSIDSMNKTFKGNLEMYKQEFVNDYDTLGCYFTIEDTLFGSKRYLGLNKTKLIIDLNFKMFVQYDDSIKSINTLLSSNDTVFGEIPLSDFQVLDTLKLDTKLNIRKIDLHANLDNIRGIYYGEIDDDVFLSDYRCFIVVFEDSEFEILLQHLYKKNEITKINFRNF
jgi:hypothetical protein